MPIRSCLSLALILAALLLGLPPGAQAQLAVEVAVAEAPEDGAPGDSIVVTGRAEVATPAQIHRQARAISASSQHLHIPLARFEDPICVGVLGLPEDHAGLLIDQVRLNASRLGIRVQGDGCEANFIIAFVADSQASLSELMRRNPAEFQFLDMPDRRAMLAPGPVHVWLDIRDRTRDGMPIHRSRDLFNPPVSGQQMAHSLIYTATRRDIVSAMVIFTASAAGGLSIRQLADYATMRGLAETRPAPGMALTSILGLFDTADGRRAAGLTAFDQAWLTAVYSNIPNVPAAFKLGNVASELRRILANSSDGAQ